MNRPPLHIVAPGEPTPETVAEKVRRLQREAREYAVAYIADALADMERLTAKAQEIAAGGEAFPDGVRQEMDAARPRDGAAGHDHQRDRREGVMVRVALNLVWSASALVVVAMTVWQWIYHGRPHPAVLVCWVVIAAVERLRAEFLR